MSFNGSGTFVINSTGQPVAANTLIESSVFNAFTADIATGLSTCITKDGQTTVTANIPFGGYKLTGIGAATARTDAASLATIQDGTGIYVATVGGTADAITLTPSPAIAAYAAGQAFYWLASGANTTAVTLQVSGIASPKAITKNGTTALVAGDIPSGALVGARYDGTQFQLISLGAATYQTPLPVADTQTIVKGSSDPTKLLRFEIDGFTGGATRVATPPDEDFTIVGVATTQTLTSKTLTSPVLNTGVSGTAIADASAMAAMTSSTTIVTPAANKIILGTEQASTSVTSIDFTGVPAGVRRITIHINGLSLSGTSNILVQLGDAGSFENTGYAGSNANISAGTAGGPTAFSAGFIVSAGSTAAAVHYAQLTLVLINSATFTWSYSGIDGSDVPTTSFGAGTKSLSAELTQVRITTVNGSDTFDANGGINISYER